MKHPLATRLLAEAFGTALLVGVGTGAMVEGARLGGLPQWELAVAWFAAVTIPIVALESLSGAHLNPVVTLGQALAGRFPRGEVLPYLAAQLAGAFAGSAAVLASLGGAAHLGATMPAGGLVARAFLGEFVFTFGLLSAVFALVLYGPGRWRWRLLLPGAVVALATYFVGPWSGSSLNPSRSLAPAVLSGTYASLWVYFVAPPLAALLAAVIFRWGARHAARPGTAAPL